MKHKKRSTFAGLVKLEGNTLVAFVWSEVSELSLL